MDRLDPIEQRGDDCPLEGRQEIDDVGRERRGIDRLSSDVAFLKFPEHRGLQSRKREVVRPVAGAAHGKRVPGAVPARGDPVDDGSARIAEARAPRHLVERFAGRVVPRPRDRRDPVRLDPDELGVAARHHQSVEREIRRKRGLAGRAQERREEVTLQMVDRDERDSAREGERLAGREPDEKRADQPGPGGRRDQIDLLDRRVSLGERLLEGDREVLEVRAGRDLGNDAAVRSVRGELRGDDVREHAAVPVEDRNGGLVAGSFDAEDEHGFRQGRTGNLSLRAASARRSSRQTKGRLSVRSSQKTRAAASWRASAARSGCVPRSRSALARTLSTDVTSIQRPRRTRNWVRATVSSWGSIPSRRRLDRAEAISTSVRHQTD